MRVALVLFFVLIQLKVFSQITVGFNVSYNSFAHEDLKNLQEQTADVLPSNPVISESFPAYFGYEGNIAYNFNKNSIGLYVFATSTGGRVSYSDYSGIFVFDQNLKMAAIGGVFKRRAGNWGKIEGVIGVRIGIVSTKYIEDITFEIYDLISDGNINEYKSLGLQFRPSFGIAYPLFDFFKIYSEIGFELNSSSKFVVDGADTDIKPNWSGVRLSIGIIIL